MVNYRRDKTRGGSYFFTLTLHNRSSTLLTQYTTQLGYAFRRAKKNNFFTLDAIVILPEHLHMIMSLPDGDSNYATRLRHIKTYFLRSVLKAGEPLLKNRRDTYNLWQHRYWEHCIRNDKDLEAHIAYIHFNPVKHGLVDKVIDWPHSSFHRYVRDGLLPEHWSEGLQMNELRDLE